MAPSSRRPGIRTHPPEVTLRAALDGDTVNHAGGRRGCALLLLLLLGAALPAHASRTITLCFERQDVPPWRSVAASGLNFELLNAVAQKLDLHFDYQSMPWKRCLAQLQENAVDGAFAVSFKADRMALGVYPGGAEPDASKRMHVDRYVLLRRKGSRVDWDGKQFRDLEGAVGFQLGYSVGDFLRAQHVVVDEGSGRATELAQKLLAGRLGAAAVGGSDGATLMAGPLAGQLEMLPTALVEKPYYLIVSHALAGADAALAARIWQAIEQVREGAAYKKQERQLAGAHH